MGSSWLRGGTGCRGSVSLTDSEIIPPAGRGAAAQRIPYNGNHMKFRLAVSAAVLAAVVLGQQPQRRERPVRLAARGTRGAGAGGTEDATEAGMRMYTQIGRASLRGIR